MGVQRNFGRGLRALQCVLAVGLVSCLLGSLPAWAASPVQVTITNSQGFDAAQLKTVITDQIEQAFHLVQPKKYLDAIADSNALSNKGLGVSYAMGSDDYVLGASVNASVILQDSELNTLPVHSPLRGAAVNGSVMLGVGFGQWGWDGLSAYVDYFEYGAPVRQLDNYLRHAGFHLQYAVWRPSEEDTTLWQWGGFTFTTGVEYTRLSIGIAEQLTTPLSLQSYAGASQLPADLQQLVGAETAVDLVSNGTLDIVSEAWLVPFEISTSLRFMYLLSVFAGVGVDVAWGETSLDIALNGKLRNQQQGDIGTATITASEQGNPISGQVRFFGGVQVNVWVLRIFAQANMNLEEAMGVTAGVRAAW